MSIVRRVRWPFRQGMSLALLIFPVAVGAQPIAGMTAETASANLFADHPGGCLAITVEATHVKHQGRILSKLVSLSLFQDGNGADCSASGALRLLASGQTDQAYLSVSDTLSEARVGATVPVTFHATGARSLLVLSATWSGVGDRPYSERRRVVGVDGGAPPVAHVHHVHGYMRAASVRVALSDAAGDYAARLSRSEGSLHVSTAMSSQ